ncbi:protein of unknown function (plasmid) [Azospirillum lipoferum 4B]|uniref:Uncharacterized protein n=1 Tax=Azospirillum lipoferum (strain 4B) TaxID=862719 RepID=G7ZCJ0_AZOL4|nr:protein of unknown function [Azospirillum lipoferum 4B]
MMTRLTCRQRRLRRPAARLPGPSLRKRHIREQDRSAGACAVRGAMENGYAAFCRRPRGLVRHDVSPQSDYSCW